MTLKQLEYFMEVSRHLSFSAAARVLYISQPALSRGISALEEELGVILLFRDKHNVALTPAGLVLATALPKLKSGLEKLVVEVQQAREGMSGKLVVGFQSGMRLPDALSDTLDYLNRNMPFIEMTPVCGESRELCSLLAYGNVDIIYMCDGQLPTGENIESLPLETVPMCYAYLPQEGGRSFSPAEQTYIFSGAEASQPAERWKAYCRSHGFSPKLRFAENFQTRDFLIESRSGAGIFPSCHRIFDAEGMCRREIDPDFTADCSLYWNSVNLNSSVDVFIKLMKGNL